MTRIFGFVAVGICLSSALAQDKPTIGKTTAKNFENRAFYSGTNLNQVKSILRGGQGEPLSNSQIALSKGVELETFSPSGRKELRLHAETCVYDSKARQASSPSAIRAESGDGQYTIAGEGFLWLQADNSFFLSNKVHSTVDTGALNTKSASTNKSPSDQLDIFADRFDFDGKQGVATYEKNLRVVGTNFLLTSAVLKIRRAANTNAIESLSAETNVVLDYEQIRATSDRAVYTTSSNLVQLFGNPRWRAGDREGRGDEISVDRTNRILRSSGNAYLKMPVSGEEVFLSGKKLTNSTAQKSDRFIEIFSDSHIIQTNRAVFHGNVRASEIVSNQPHSKITCQMLIVEISRSNEVERAVAELDVVISQDDKSFTAQSAVYTSSNGILVLRGSPSWHAGIREGKGDELRIDTLSERMIAKGNGWLKLPAGQITAMMPGSTNAVAPPEPKDSTNTFAEIFSDQYVFTTNRADFQGNVRILHPQVTMTCGTMVASFSQTQPDKEIVAEQNVIIDLTDSKGQKYHGTGDKAVYTYSVSETATNDVVTLSGNPKFEVERGIWHADVLKLDRINNTITGPKTRFIAKPGARIASPKEK